MSFLHDGEHSLKTAMIPSSGRFSPDHCPSWMLALSSPVFPRTSLATSELGNKPSLGEEPLPQLTLCMELGPKGLVEVQNHHFF